MVSSSSSTTASPQVDEGFRWDGTTSDLAQQYYRRFQANATVDPLVLSSEIPKEIQTRLDESRVAFTDLPGLLQRALVWDSGFALTRDNQLTRIRTLDGVSMAKIAVSKFSFEKVAGCTVTNCTELNGTAWHKSLQCNGDQMNSVSLCAVEDFAVGDEVHVSMWSSGGNDSMVPEMRLLKHNWRDEYTDGGKDYSVAAIHTDTEAHEPAYGTCALGKETSVGVGSIVIACYLPNQMNATIEARMQPPARGAIVTTWLQQHAKPPPSTGFNTTLLIPIIAGAVLVVGVLVCLILRRKSKEAARGHAPRRLGVDPSALLTSPRGSVSKRGMRSWSSDSERLTMYTDAGGRSTTSGKPSLHAIEEYDSGASSSVMKILLSDPNLVNMQLAYDQIHFGEVISKGAYGEVWVGYCNRQTVALKRLLRTKNQAFDDVATFTYEIQLSAALRHPNIVQFLGVAWNNLENLVMVLEYLPRGDLAHVLRTNGNELSWADHKLDMARGLVSAVAYLHTQSPAIIHRDLKSRNVLLSADFEPKLIDFGVSRRKKDKTMTAGVGTPFWTAPEVLEGTRYSEKSDIYSLGVLLTELDTGLLPYHNATGAEGEKLQHFQILNLVVAGELRPSLSGQAPDFIRDAIVGCLQHDPEMRPTAQELYQKLYFSVDYYL